MTEHSFGCIPSPPDERDFQLASYVAPVSVPASLSYRSMMTPVRNQGNLGSCVGFASTALDEHIHGAANLSEMWCYDQCKKLDGYEGEGTYPRIAMKVLTQGICEEGMWPYQDRYPPSTQPNPSAAANARNYRIGTYASSTIDGLKAGLFQHGPMLLAFGVYENYTQARDTGVIPAPAGKRLGGHAVCLTGYDDNKALWEWKNSWAFDWGDEGYGYFPYSVLPFLFMEAWTVVDDGTISKPWPDWPDEQLEAAKFIKDSGAMQGFPDGSFRPYDKLTYRHVALIANRVGLTAPREWLETYAPCTRAAVRDTLSGFTWLEERWDEQITRYQLALLLYRYLKEKA